MEIVRYALITVAGDSAIQTQFSEMNIVLDVSGQDGGAGGKVAVRTLTRPNRYAEVNDAAAPLWDSPD